MTFRILAALLLSLLASAQTPTQIDYNTQIKNKPALPTLPTIYQPLFDVREYHFAAQTPGGTLSAGVAATVTLTPVPSGVNGADTAHWLRISAGTGGAAESVLITGGTAVAGSPSGTITFTPANSHGGAWTITSATSDIQETVVAAQTAGAGKVQIPPSNWPTYAPLAISHDGIYIEGAGQGATTITCTGGTYDCISFTNHASNGRLHDLALVGSGKTGGAGVRLDTVGYMELDHIWVNEMYAGVILSDATLIWLDHVSIRDTTTNCIYIWNGIEVTIDNLVIDNIPANAQNGIMVDAVSGFYVSQSSLIHCDIGLKIDPPNGVLNIAMYLSQALFDTGGNGIEISPLGTGPFGTAAVVDFRCTDCWVSSNSLRGVNIRDSVQDIVFEGLTSVRNGQEGFATNGNVTLRNSTIAANSQSSAGTYANVVVAPGGGNFHFENNVIGGTYAYFGAEKAGYDILLLGGASDNFTIRGNILQTSLSGTLYDQTTGTNARVELNSGWNPVGVSTITPGSSPYTYRAGHSPETVYISGGTVSSIVRGSATLATSTSANAIAVPLPPNGTLTVTYSATPTMAKDVQ